MKKFFICLVCLLPSPMAAVILRGCGFGIDWSAKIGLSIVWVDTIEMGPKSRIGHLNLIACNEISMKQLSYIGRANIIIGTLEVNLAEEAAIGNGNKIVRGPASTVSVTPSKLSLGVLTKITSNHRVDAGRSVTFGNYSVLAGTSSEIWTHGYFLESEGRGRYRVDGDINVGDNTYIGSRSLISAGVKVGSNVHVGPGSTITKDLLQPGVYVAPNPICFSTEPMPTDFYVIDHSIKTERVFQKL